MFQFPRLPRHDVPWKALAFRVPPFGHPGIEARVRLPRDFRGLPRPSSAPCAKASAVRPPYPRDTRSLGPFKTRIENLFLSFCAMRLSGCPRSSAIASRGGRTLRIGRSSCLGAGFSFAFFCVSLERR